MCSQAGQYGSALGVYFCKAWIDTCAAAPYIAQMIRSFRSKALRWYAKMGDTAKLSVQNLVRLKLILDALNTAARPEQMNIPGLRFHALKGQDKGRYAVDASANWRITFAWQDTDAVDVDLEDYH